MNRFVRWMLGIVTVVDVLAFYVMAGLVLFGKWRPMHHGTWTWWVFAPILAYGLQSWGLLIFYQRHIQSTDELSPENRTYWLRMIRRFCLSAMPFYWYHVIWPERRNG